jgi:hypothetical protein
MLLAKNGWTNIRLLWSLHDHAEPSLGGCGRQPGSQRRELRIGMTAKQTDACRIRIGVATIRQRQARGVSGCTKWFTWSKGGVRKKLQFSLSASSNYSSARENDRDKTRLRALGGWVVDSYYLKGWAGKTIPRAGKTRGP